MFTFRERIKIKSTLVALTLGALCTAAMAQNDNPMGGQGSITSQTEFKREIRNPNDTGVAGTEFFKLTYDCKWELVKIEGTEEPRKSVECVLTCKGNKHIKHTDCDLSCDTPCPANVHRFSFTGRAKNRSKAMEKAEMDADNLVRATGADPHAANWTSYYTRALRNARHMAEQLRNYAVPCWNDAPCTTWKRVYGVARYEFRVTGTLTENGYYMSKGVKTSYQARNRGTHTETVADIWLPQDDHVDWHVDYKCKCEPAKVKDFGKGDGPNKGKGEKSIWDGFLLWDDDEDVIETPNDKVRLLITGIDLNHVHIEVQNDLDEGITLLLGGGLILTPKDGSTQSMTLLVETKLVVAAHSTGSVDARSACIEMNKKEPTSSSVFTLSKQTNSALRDLASITNASRFRGPVDQARVWILTDHATYDQIKDHLIPSPTKGQYLNALYDVAQANGVDIEDPKFKPCFDPSLLVSTTARAEAVEWMVRHLDRTNPGTLSDLAGKYGKEIADTLGAKADDIDIAHVTELVRSLCSCSSAHGRMAGLSLLLNAVPESRRDSIVSKGGLEEVICSTESEDPKEQEKALEVLDVYCHKPSANEVAKLAALGASEQVRAKATELAKKLSG